MLVCFGASALCVGIHFELAFQFGGYVVPRLRWKRFRSLVIVTIALFAHLIEICVFAATLYISEAYLLLGSLRGPHSNSLLDYFYFSGVTFTTLGYGDFVPVGELRLIVAVEALVGLVLIAWTATITFFQMIRMN